MNVNEYKHPFGQGWQERNKVEEYVREALRAYDDRDGLRWIQTKEEILSNYGQEGLDYIWRILASYTRSTLKKLEDEGDR